METIELGSTTVTPKIKELIEQNNDFAQFVFKSIHRHQSKDWGDMCKDDKLQNDEAVINGSRILSCYLIDINNINEEKIWIITVDDRTYTTVLFPNEY